MRSKLRFFPDLRQWLQDLLRPLVALAALGSALVAPAADSSVAIGGPTTKPTIVLVHGAFAESGSWNGVMTRLIAQGYPVVAAAVPLRGLRSDADYMAALFQAIPGPIVAVGHSYGGLVITDAAAGNPRVKALVYVAAFAPEAGESGGDLAGRFPGSTLGPTLAPPVLLPEGGKDLYIQQDKYHAQFAADVPEAEAKLMAAAQRPIVESAFHEPATSATWRTVPSWFVFGSLDKNIPEKAHAFMAERAHARETVKVEGASHVVMISHADTVAALIVRAAMVVTAVAGKSVPAGAPLPVQGSMPVLKGATTWLNSPPLAADSLRGKVILVQFWTYSCINWLRTLPYVRAWADKYRDQGLVVIGVHTPEFEFERELENVRRAARDLRVGYPIAVDSDRKVWRAFDNNSWPALYFVDAKGRIRHQAFGEGKYEQSELIIQQLLAEAGAADIGQDLVSVHARGAEAGADWGSLQSPENYVGYERTENFISPRRAGVGKRRPYTVPAQLPLNHWALAGDWTMKPQAVVLNQADGRIAYRFRARDLHLVMGPAMRGNSVQFRVLIDGQPPGAAHGFDVDDQGYGKVVEPRLYQLIRQPQPIVDRFFEIEFFDPGVEAFSFTFG